MVFPLEKHKPTDTQLKHSDPAGGPNSRSHRGWIYTPRTYLRGACLRSPTLIHGRSTGGKWTALGYVPSVYSPITDLPIVENCPDNKWYLFVSITL